MPRSRSIVRIASTSRPENCARVRDRVARREVAAEGPAGEVALEHGLAEERGSARRLARGSRDRLRHRVDHEPRVGAVLARVDEAARDLHRAHDLRRGRTTSISVTIVVLASGAIGRRDRPVRSAIAVGDAPLVGDHQHAVAAQQQAVARCRRARACRSRRRSPASITRSVRSVTAKIRRPSVLMTSGSSTSASCVLVPEKSGTAPPVRPRPLTGRRRRRDDAADRCRVGRRRQHRRRRDASPARGGARGRRRRRRRRVRSAPARA